MLSGLTSQKSVFVDDFNSDDESENQRKTQKKKHYKLDDTSMIESSRKIEEAEKKLIPKEKIQPLGKPLLFTNAQTFN